MSQHLLCLGECMVEVAPAPVNGLFQIGFAGDTFNSAWYVRKLLPAEWQVSYATAVGQDQISSDFLAFANDAGLTTDQVQVASDKTMGLYMVHLADGERSFSYWRGQSAAKTMADEAAALEAMLESADVLYFSGISVAILTVAGRENLFAALAKAKDRGQKVIFDPNLRPKLWQDIKTMTETIARFASVATTALPSFDDEASFYGDQNPEDTLARYAIYGVTEIVVKNGAGQIIAIDEKGQRWDYLPQAIASPVDTTAAGDSFNAGYLAARLTGATLGAALADGSDLAGKVVMGRGALVELD